ncbi:MAG: ribonuclease P protein component [Methylococcaceae bacterium]|nr:ribonuclease P protein component [Methylococcaceae bacterium]
MAAATFGFPHEHRLGKPADFKYVFEKAEKSADTYLTVLARVNDRGHARLGLAIAKKQIPRASARNRIKRLIRESFRLRQAELGSVDIVVLARSSARLSDGETLRNSLEKHWKALIKRCDSC